MSLLRTAARASVATRVIGNTQRRQQQRWAAEDAASVAAPASAPVAPPAPAAATALPEAAPAAPAADMGGVIAQLQQLAQLRDAGAISEAEFENLKAAALASAR